MTLYQMLQDRRSEILELSRTKMTVALDLPGDQPLQRGLVLLYDELLSVFRLAREDETEATRQGAIADNVATATSRRHAQEAYRMGYTVTQLVRGYGSICQGITEYAQTSATSITASEFAELNLCLDVAIAEAVTEFQAVRKRTTDSDERLRVGSLVHELRNHLTSAMLAHEMIRMGGVAASGATSTVLTNSLRQMRILVDRSIAQVRMDSTPEFTPTAFRLLDLMSEVEISLAAEADAKTIHIEVEVDASLHVRGDEHLMVSAVTNLVQNAVKFTHIGGIVWMRAYAEGEDAVIEIEDQCGGLPEGQAEHLFDPFTQQGEDRSGLGLGLSIVKRAAHVNGCKLAVRNFPSVGCLFSLRMPRHAG